MSKEKDKYKWYEENIKKFFINLQKSGLNYLLSFFKNDNEEIKDCSNGNDFDIFDRKRKKSKPKNGLMPQIGCKWRIVSNLNKTY